MLLIDSRAEQQIRAAIRRGELEKLPGEGKPLALDDDSGVSEELRVPWRILKNAGCVPPELTLRREIQQVEGLLDRVEPEYERQAIQRRLCLLRARLATRGGEVDLLAREAAYREKVISRLAAGEGN